MSKEITTVVPAPSQLRRRHPARVWPSVSYAPVVAWVVFVNEDGTGFYVEPVRADDFNHTDTWGTDGIRQPHGSIVFVGVRMFAKDEESEALACELEARAARGYLRGVGNGTSAAAQ